MIRFKEIDKDNCGYLTRDEFEELLAIFDVGMLTTCTSNKLRLLPTIDQNPRNLVLIHPLET